MKSMPLKSGIFVDDFEELILMYGHQLPSRVENEMQLFLAKGDNRIGNFSVQDKDRHGKYWTMITYTRLLDDPDMLAFRKAVIVFEYCHFVFFAEMLQKPPLQFESFRAERQLHTTDQVKLYSVLLAALEDPDNLDTSDVLKYAYLHYQKHINGFDIITVWKYFLLSEQTLVNKYLREFIDGDSEQVVSAPWPRSNIQRAIEKNDAAQLKRFADSFFQFVADRGKYKAEFVRLRYRESIDEIQKEIMSRRS